MGVVNLGDLIPKVGEVSLCAVRFSVIAWLVQAVRHR